MIIQTLKCLERTKEETADEFSFRVQSVLKKNGFSFLKEVKVQNRGDGRTGRIDIVASKNNTIYAIELDRDKPRKKSIFKLQNYPANVRLIVSRVNNQVIEL